MTDWLRLRSDWPWYSVRELQSRGSLLVEDGNHGEYRPRPNEFGPTGTAYIRAADLSDGSVLFGSAGRVSSAAIARVRKGIGRPGDILFSHKGTVGKVARAPADAPPFICSPQTTFWRVTDLGVLDPRFLYVYLRSAEFVRQWTARKGDTDMADYVSLTAQRTLLVPIPPMQVQRKIASVVSAYDDLIENNTRRIHILEEMAAAIYREWFVEFRFPGHEYVKVVDTQHGPLPEGWNWHLLGSMAEDMRRSVQPQSVPGETPYFGLEHLPEHSIALSDWGRAEEATSTKYRFEVGEILFGKIRPYFHKVGPPPVDGICSTDAIVIRPKDAGHKGLVLAVVSSDRFVSHAVQTSQGTKMPRANWQVLKEYPVALPQDVALIGEFEHHMHDSVRLIHVLVLANRNLRTTRDLLLPRLISGEIDVSNLDIGDAEPAA